MAPTILAPRDFLSASGLRACRTSCLCVGTVGLGPRSSARPAGPAPLRGPPGLFSALSRGLPGPLPALPRGSRSRLSTCPPCTEFHASFHRQGPGHPVSPLGLAEHPISPTDPGERPREPIAG